MAPVLEPLRRSFEESLTDAEQKLIAEARAQKEESLNEATDKKPRGKKKGAYHKELSKIAFDHESGLDEIWDELSEDLSKWQLDLANLQPKVPSADESLNRKKNKSKGHRRAGFSRLEFLMMDF